MTQNGHARPSWHVFSDVVRTQLWPVPALAILAAVALGVGMPQLDARIVPRLPEALTGYLFGGGPEAARSVLQAIAGSLITVTSLTFSLTVVTLQLASSQHSPRLLRTFTRDRMVHATLAILLATFTFALTVMRTVRTALDDDPAFVPQLSVTIAFLLALASVMAVAVFLAHLARKIRPESMLRDVHSETEQVIHRLLPELPQEERSSTAPRRPAGQGLRVHARTSGFLTIIDEKRLLAAVVDADAVVHVDRMAGQSVIAGTPIATVWAADGRVIDEEAGAALTDRISAAVRTGFERTASQDIAFGLRQLVDVTTKALSPGINDPTTAVHALSHVAALLCDIARRDLGPQLLRDNSGHVRAVLRRPDFPTLLDLAVGQPRRYGAAEPEVLGRLLMMLREIAWVARDHEQRRAVADQLARLRRVIDRQAFDDTELAELAGLAVLAENAIHGAWPSEDSRAAGRTE